MSFAFGSDPPSGVGRGVAAGEAVVAKRLALGFAKGVDHGRTHPTTDAINAQHVNARNKLARTILMRSVPCRLERGARIVEEVERAGKLREQLPLSAGSGVDDLCRGFPFAAAGEPHDQPFELDASAIVR
jgi:hypothetical protein